MFPGTAVLHHSGSRLFRGIMVYWLIRAAAGGDLKTDRPDNEDRDLNNQLNPINTYEKGAFIFHCFPFT